MICPIRIVVHPTLARASGSALAVAAWLIFSTMVAGHPCHEARAFKCGSDIGVRHLSACDEPGYCSCKQRGPGGVELQLSEDGLRLEISMRFQPMSVA
jgi:hypothetical protein